ERTNETRLQLPSLPKPNNALCRRNLQKHMVAHLKGQVLPPNICIALLSALGCQQPLPDQLDLLRTVLNQLGSKQPTLTHLPPANRRSARPAIKCLKRSHTNTGMVTIVVGKLYQRQLTIPTVFPVQTTRPEHIF